MSEAAQGKSSGKKKDIVYYIHVVIILFFMFGFPQLGPFGPLSEMGMHALGIFISLLWAWTFVDFIWPSILAMVAVGLTGFMTIDQSFASGFGNATTLNIMFIFGLAAFMTASGICKTVAYWFVSRKSCIGKPYVFVTYLLFACFILGGTAGAVPTYIMAWAIIYEIADVTGFKMKDSFIAALLVGVVFSAILGTNVLPFRPFAAIALNQSRQIAGIECSFLDWAIPNLVACVATILLYILFIKFILRPNVDPLKKDEDIFAHFRTGFVINGEQKVAIALMLAIIIFASVPSFLPAGSLPKEFMSKFTIGPIIATLMALFHALHKNGKTIMDFAGSMTKGVEWPTVIMIASSMPVAEMIQSPDSGVSALINDFLTLFLGNYSPFIIAVLFILFSTILTQVAHNLVLMIVLTPILLNLAISMGFPPMPALMFLAFGCSMGLATPGASVMGAMIYANRDWISAKQAAVYTSTAVVASIIAMIATGLPLAFLMEAGM